MVLTVMVMMRIKLIVTEILVCTTSIWQASYHHSWINKHSL